MPPKSNQEENTKRKRRKRKRDDTNDSSNHNHKNSNHSKEEEIMCFQDWFPQSPSFLHHPSSSSSSPHKTNKKNESGIDNMIDPSEAFFELANAPYVSYKIPSSVIARNSGRRKRSNSTNNNKRMKISQESSSSSSSSDDTDTSNDESSVEEEEEEEDIVVTVKQDNNCGNHTGGIVWETSYLLATFLLEKYGHCRHNSTTTATSIDEKQYKPLGRVLELGSGCGMLGLILAASELCQVVVSTETTDVMKNLTENIQKNIICNHDNHNKKKEEGNGKTSLTKCCHSGSIVPKLLRWDDLETDIHNDDELKPHSFDTIIGTDVVFTPHLVVPLLQTMQKMSHEKTMIFLCLQIRCADSHALLLKEAHKFGFEVKDVSQIELLDERMKRGCSWGLDLDCILLQFVVIEMKEKNM